MGVCEKQELHVATLTRLMSLARWMQNNATHLGVFDKIRRQMASGVKEHMDADKDGKVHRSEFLAVLHQGEL